MVVNILYCFFSEEIMDYNFFVSADADAILGMYVGIVLINVTGFGNLFQI